MPTSGLDYLAPVRSFRNLFGRYGTNRGAIRGIFNAVIPVAVVDRYRDDTEGSLYGMEMTGSCPPGSWPAFACGSVTDDWELLQANMLNWNFGTGATEWWSWYVYTPDASYVPVQLASPPGFWTPGLNTDWSFTLSSVTGLAGSNLAAPARGGFHPQSPVLMGPGANRGFAGSESGPAIFDPPIRVYRDVTLGFLGYPRAAEVNCWLSILYRVRPRTTDGPRTG